LEGHHQVLVGVNDYQTDEFIELESLKLDPAVEQRQVERLKHFKINRNEQQVQVLLNNLEQTARSEQNLLPIMIESVEGSLTLGEICGVLRKVWGEYQPPVWA